MTKPLNIFNVFLGFLIDFNYFCKKLQSKFKIQNLFLSYEENLLLKFHFT